MMYRQILLREEEHRHQHIFYRPNQDSPILEFQLNAVTYGLTPVSYTHLDVYKRQLH